MKLEILNLFEWETHSVLLEKFTGWSSDVHGKGGQDLGSFLSVDVTGLDVFQ